MSSDSTLRRGEGREKKKKMECTFLSSFCSSSVSMASLFSPAASLPPLSLAFSSFSLPSVAIYPLSHFFFLPLSKMPPDPYLSILSPSQFSAPFLLFLACRSSRCHQVFCRRRETRRKPAQSGGQPTTCGTQNALVMVTSRLRFRIDEHFFFSGDIPVRHAGPWRSDM